MPSQPGYWGMGSTIIAAKSMPAFNGAVADNDTALVAAVRDQSWVRLVTAGLVAGLTVLPWTVRNYLVPNIGGMKLTKLGHQHVEKLYAEGVRNRLLLSNRAIMAYEHARRDREAA